MSPLVFLQNKESLTVLVVGKGGVGKSSTVNSIVGERVTIVSAFQVMQLRKIWICSLRSKFWRRIVVVKCLRKLFSKDW